MLKKFLFFALGLFIFSGFAFAAVDVNTADQAALDSIPGIGPTKSKSILEERKKGGNFKDWADLEERVKGIGEKNSIKLSAGGLVVNGQPRQGTATGTKPVKPVKVQAEQLKAGDKSKPGNQ